ncbi:protein sel-1 homolog 3 [Pholidichthys leucotaenia]
MACHVAYKYLLQFCLCIQIVWGLDKVTLLNPPEEAVPDYFLKILYSCDEAATVHLDCVVSFETGAVSTFPLRQWTCAPGDPKIRTLKLNLPDWLVYQADGIVPDSQWVLSCILQASVRHRVFGGGERTVTAQDVAHLKPKSYLSRRVKQHQLCIAWSAQMLHLTKEAQKKQCPAEQETVHLLSSVYASTGEGFGITKSLEPFKSDTLEYLRIRAITFPWCTFSMWIFVTRHCQESLCGIFYHVDSNNNYATPAVFLTNSGQLHIQMSGESQESSAFLFSSLVPLNEWCQLSVTLTGRTVTVSMMCVAGEQRTVKSVEYVLKRAAMLDDTEGYFVIGGGKYIKGVEGYLGQVNYYRNRIPPHSLSEVVIPDVIKNLNLTGWLQTCQEFRLEMLMKIRGFSLQARQAAQSETCFGALCKWTAKDGLPSFPQCHLWEAAAPHRRYAAELAKLLVFKHGGRSVSLHSLGRALFSLSLHKVGRASSIRVFSRILPLLLQAGCLSDNQALHMSSVLYSTGLGVQEQPVKAWLLALLASQKDDRLALLHLGHLHHQGPHGYPADTDLAYAYYSNIASQTTLDRLNPTPEQTFVEAIFLNNDEELNLQTNANHHIFQWLKHQARRGVAEAEQAVARMLFWGQQGVAPNIQEAARHYKRGAVQWEDPVSMYDYGIVLLQGQGVEQDIPKAVTFLKKAMDKGHIPAISALAWYYEQHERDYKQAVQLWEQADILNCPDAALNLGVVHSQGLYPGKAANQYMAYLYYMKSAQRGHIRGAVLLAEIWTTGIPGLVARHPSDAVLWVKWAAEHNGYLGSILRKALDSYLKNDMLSSLFYYMVAAESGYPPAQFNVAYLCEQNRGSFLDPSYATLCMWRYYNLTIQSQNPDTYAFIRMGDLLNDRQKNLFAAAHMYTQAALKSNPQGWYSLGLLVEEGYKLPLSILIELGISELYLADKHSLLSVLYKRCRDSEVADSYLPCSLALFNVYIQSFQEDYSAAIEFSTAVTVVAAPTMLLIILSVLRRHILSQIEPRLL